MDLRVHFLEAQASLDGFRDPIGRRIARGAELLTDAIRGRVPAQPIDVLVVAAPGRGIPGLGISGSCFSASRLEIFVDPFDPDTQSAIASGEIEGTLAHEFHHALRWAGPGYGRTLGEALISEGLADHFDGLATGRPAPVWCRRLDAPSIAAVAALAAAEAHSDAYDHGRWFFGGGELPDGAGYSLGYEIVRRFLARHPDSDAATLAHAPAERILQDLPIADGSFAQATGA